VTASAHAPEHAQARVPLHVPEHERVHERVHAPAQARGRVEACWSWSNSSYVITLTSEAHHSAAAARLTGPVTSLVYMG
jgi:hypothetical protein